jgi:serine/threonine protein kinase
MEAGNLHNVLRSMPADIPIPLHIKKRVARDIALAMNYLHKCDIIHRYALPSISLMLTLST